MITTKNSNAKKKKLKLKQIIIGVFCLLLLIIAGFAVHYKLNIFGKYQGTDQDQKTITDNWKTYTNSINTLSLKYPESWKANENKSDQYTRLKLSGNEGEIDIDWGGGFGGACPQGYEKIQISGKPIDACHAIQEDGSENWSLGGFSVNKIDHSGFILVKTPYRKNRELVLKVFSTIKFVKPTQNDMTANWKTYTNPEFGIQFVVPPYDKEFDPYTLYSSKKQPVIEDPQYAKYNQYAYYDKAYIINSENNYRMGLIIRVPINGVTDAETWYAGYEKPITFPDRNPKKEKNIINGNQVFIVKDRNRVGNSGTKDLDEYFFVKNNIVYIFNFENFMDIPGAGEQIQTILESIKFMEPNLSNLPSPTTQSKDLTACTQEAKTCPDGSSVGRAGPKCEFTACPK